MWLFFHPPVQINTQLGEVNIKVWTKALDKASFVQNALDIPPGTKHCPGHSRGICTKHCLSMVNFCCGASMCT